MGKIDGGIKKEAVLRRTIYTIIGLWLAVAMGGCSDDSPNTPTGPGGPANIWPLALGNWWAMHYELKLAGMTMVDEVDTTRIDTTLNWGNNTWYGSKSDTVFMRNAADGVRSLTFSGRYPNGIEELYIKYPVAVGESWLVASDTLTIRVVSNSESITVPAGTFVNCIKYAVTQPSAGANDYYLKPGVGLILVAGSHSEMGFEITEKVELAGYYVR